MSKYYKPDPAKQNIETLFSNLRAQDQKIYKQATVRLIKAYPKFLAKINKIEHKLCCILYAITIGKSYDAKMAMYLDHCCGINKNTI